MLCVRLKATRVYHLLTLAMLIKLVLGVWGTQEHTVVVTGVVRMERASFDALEAVRPESLIVAQLRVVLAVTAHLLTELCAARQLTLESYSGLVERGADRRAWTGSVHRASSVARSSRTEHFLGLLRSLALLEETCCITTRHVR